jgi:SAM-dependent methyltransferase
MLEFMRLAMRRKRSAEHYRSMQEYIAQKTVAELWARGIDLSKCHVVELAAGAGGYSRTLWEGSRSFVATDLHPSPFFEQQGIPFMPFDATEPFPLEPGSVDLIYSSSLIEHVAQPLELLRECRRVLRKDGILYLSFPPFYSLSLVGGHMFKPFHLLGERFAIKIYNLLHATDIESYMTAWKGYGLFPLTISDVEGMIRESGFEIAHVYTRLSPINTARLPGFLKDLATWHVCYIARA